MWDLPTTKTAVLLVLASLYNMRTNNNVLLVAALPKTAKANAATAAILGSFAMTLYQ
jgi:hypothetical protein